jgi:hypothetical protein
MTVAIIRRNNLNAFIDSLRNFHWLDAPLSACDGSEVINEHAPA